MSYFQDNIAELNLLMHFDLSSSQRGIKIHQSADSSVIAAARSLFEKGLITQEDGGYLTEIGLTAAEHTHLLYSELNRPVLRNRVSHR